MGKRRAKPDVRERFGTAVKFRREELGMTQENLAEKAGIHRTYLSDVERGTRNLSLVNIERLAATKIAAAVAAKAKGENRGFARADGFAINGTVLSFALVHSPRSHSPSAEAAAVIASGCMRC